MLTEVLDPLQSIKLQGPHEQVQCNGVSVFRFETLPCGSATQHISKTMKSIQAESKYLLVLQHTHDSDRHKVCTSA
jgi:hypothetical protein